MKPSESNQPVQNATLCTGNEPIIHTIVHAMQPSNHPMPVPLSIPFLSFPFLKPTQTYPFPYLSFPWPCPSYPLRPQYRSYQSPH